MHSVPTRGTVKPIEEMFAAMAADNDSSARSRIYYIEETIAVFEDRFNHRDIVDIRDALKSWLSVARDSETPDAVRIAALYKGVTPALALLGNAINHHKTDARNNLADNFAAKAENSVSKLMGVMPAPESTLDRLLSIAEGEGQASSPVRLAALSTYMMGRVQFCRMCDYVERETHAGRALKLGDEFPHAQSVHARLMADIG
jgi:hypothetical protein